MGYTGLRPKLNTIKYVPRSADPVNPAEGEVQYADGTVRPEGLWVYKNSAWTPVGSGSGSALNYILDDSSTFEGSIGSWVAYADAAGTSPVDGTGGSPNITFARSTSSPLNGTADGLLTKDAADRQGQGISCNFSLDNAYKNKPLKIKFNYAASANFVNGSLDGVTPSDVQVFMYDVTGAVLLPVFPNTLDGSGQFSSQFQASSNTSYRLILHIGSTNASAYTMQVDNFEVSPVDSAFIPADSDWVSYTPTFTGFGTPSSVSFQYRKQGPNVLIRGRFAAGTTTGVEARISLPSGLTSADINSIPSIQICGQSGYSVSANQYTVTTIEPSVTYMTLSNNSGAGGIPTKMLGNTHYSSGNIVLVFASVPIQGWTSGFTTADTVLQNVPATFTSSKNAVQSINNSTDTKIVWQTITDDSTGAWDSVNNRYTVKVPGKYEINSSIVFAANNGGHRTVRVKKNGSTLYESIQHSSSGAFVTTVPISTPAIQLAVGDYIEIWVQHDFGSAINVVNDPGTFFGMNKSETPAASMNIRKIATLKDEKASGTDGGTFTSGSYATRTLNTEVDPFGIVSLSANQFILQPGTYEINASAPAYRVDRHKIKLRNITAGSDTIIGSIAQSGNADTTESHSFLNGVFSITVATTFEIQHRCLTTVATSGLGLNTTFGDVEVYTQVEIEKLL